jgi:hypothetical protein
MEFQRQQPQPQQQQREQHESGWGHREFIRKSYYANMSLTEEERFVNLYRLMKKTRKNKRRGKDSVEFEANWAPLLVRALDDRNDRTLRILHNYTFLAPRPRWREIFATEFGGRMIDTEVCEVVIPEADKILSPFTFNNRKGMGSQAAINHLMENIFEVSEGHTKPARIVKIDFSGSSPMPYG